MLFYNSEVIKVPPKPKVFKEDIINSGFEILRESGKSAINARAVCKRLNCSTQPIFSHFSSMEEFNNALVRKAKDLYNNYIENALKKERAFKASGRAYIKFAKDEPELFKLLFMGENAENPPAEIYDENYGDVLEKVELSSGLNSEKSKQLYFYMWIYTHGIATLTATKTERFTDEQIDEILTPAYTSMLEYLRKEGNDERN